MSVHSAMHGGASGKGSLTGSTTHGATSSSVNTGSFPTIPGNSQEVGIPQDPVPASTGPSILENLRSIKMHGNGVVTGVSADNTDRTTYRAHRHGMHQARKGGKDAHVVHTNSDGRERIDWNVAGLENMGAMGKGDPNGSTMLTWPGGPSSSPMGQPPIPPLPGKGGYQPPPQSTMGGQNISRSSPHPSMPMVHTGKDLDALFEGSEDGNYSPRGAEQGLVSSGSKVTGHPVAAH